MATSQERSHLAYDDSVSLAELSADVRAAGANLSLPTVFGTRSRAVPLVDLVGREAPKRQIEVPEAARRLADALELHLG